MSVNRTHSSAFDMALEKGETAEDGFAALMGAFGAHGPKISFEVKADDRARESGRACLEFWQTDHATGLMKPSGLGISEATYWAQRIYGGTYDGFWILAQTDMLRRMAIAYQRSLKKGMTARDMAPTGDNGNRAILMPLSELVLPWKWLHEFRMSELRVEARKR